MSRRIKLITREMGEVKLLVVDLVDDKWEAEWEPLRGTEFGDLLTIIDRETLDHALHGLSRPLVDALGIPPSGALLKMPKTARHCALKSTCPFYVRSKCNPLEKTMPWCFEPDGMNEIQRQAAALAIEEWRQGVYVVICK